MKVMIVDDSAMIRQQVQFALERIQVECVEATDGIEAIEVLKKRGDINMIISDITMPRKSGLDLLADMQANADWAKIPVVMLTTEGRADMIARARNSGAKGWMVKPFDPNQLVLTVCKILGIKSPD